MNRNKIYRSTFSGDSQILLEIKKNSEFQQILKN